jgi:hypothetical protein
MSQPSAAQRYQLILADIAMAAAIQTCGGTFDPSDHGGYAPGALRDRWLDLHKEGPLRKRVTAMANAGVGALQQLPPARLQETAARFGVPLDGELATKMADHFVAKRDAWLQYNK